MTTMMLIALSALPALYFAQYFALFLHELGHFIIAKAQGLRVHYVYLGEGPELFSFSLGKTQFHFHLVPLSGSTIAAHKDEALFSLELAGGAIYITYVHEELHNLGLHVGDIIIAIDDCVITDGDHFYELSSQMYNKEIHCRILRGTEEISLPLYYPDIPTNEELEDYKIERERKWIKVGCSHLEDRSEISVAWCLASH